MTKKVKKKIEIFLKQTHPKLGKSGTLIHIRAGYARNFIIPLKIGEICTSQTIKLIEKKQKAINLKEKLYLELCLKYKNILENKQPYKITRRVNDDKKIFGKITLKQVKALLENQTKLSLENIQIELPEIKKIGIFSITLILHPKVKTEIKIEVIAK